MLIAVVPSLPHSVHRSSSKYSCLVLIGGLQTWLLKEQDGNPLRWSPKYARGEKCLREPSSAARLRGRSASYAQVLIIPNLAYNG